MTTVKNTTPPKVSIGIPTYNRAHLLRRSIESALGQAYPNIEILISDNASTDNTPDICRSYVNTYGSRIKYVRQSVNLGPTANLSKVLEMASGEFFMWLADDDWMDQHLIERCVECLRNNPSYAMAGGTVKYYDNNQFVRNGDIIRLEHDSPIKRFVNYYKKVSDNGVFYSLIRKSVIKSITMENSLGFDWIFVGFVSFQGKIKIIDNVALHRDISGAGDENYYKRVITTLGIRKFIRIHIKHPHLIIGLNIIKFFARNKEMAINPIFKTLMLFYVFGLLCLKWEVPKFLPAKIAKRIYE